MAGLILEGGSLRGIFSAGAMDALLDYNIKFNYVVGVSAGITNAASYISEQKGRNIEILRRYRNDKRYISKRNFLKDKSIFGLEFLFDEIPNKLLPFDWETYYNFNGTIKIGMTDVKTGEIVYKDGKTIDRKCTLLRATCALPFYFPKIWVEGRQYVDGGLADSIPIRQAIADKSEKNLVILTQPEGYEKKSTSSTKYAAMYFKHSYPNLAKTMINRADMYNDTIRYIKELEKTQPENIVVIKPEYKLDSFEKDVSVLEKTYQHGYSVAENNIERIKKLLD